MDVINFYFAAAASDEKIDDEAVGGMGSLVFGLNVLSFRTHKRWTRFEERGLREGNARIFGKDAFFPSFFFFSKKGEAVT